MPSFSDHVAIKGIFTAEDAAPCVSSGADGLVVSNHRGRGEDSGRATIDVLPEVVEAVKGRIVMLVGGGFRRMGANGVGVGRPYYGDSGRSVSPAWRRSSKSCAPNSASR
jgi:isopentenyl diphosphate isomerase/L-lactate dehydrogenase-like FMN-dependent dehydrogenase